MHELTMSMHARARSGDAVFGDKLVPLDGLNGTIFYLEFFFESANSPTVTCRTSISFVLLQPLVLSVVQQPSPTVAAGQPFATPTIVRVNAPLESFVDGSNITRCVPQRSAGAHI